ncbi:MAG: hypothetical protein ABI678_12665 [Kofleriaceae bacterium]
MRTLRVVSFALVFLVALRSLAHAQAAPIRVDVECEQVGRTKTCPAFLLGFVDAHPVLLSSPRAGADVVLYATANAVALADQVHLRFVGRIAGAPQVIELDLMVDTRATDEEQRAALEPAFLRGVALFVAARYPEAVTVALTTPNNLAHAAVATSPWGLSIGLTGNGNYTDKYRTATSQLDLKGVYIARNFRALTLENFSAGLNDQPPLVLDDGSMVSLDTTQYQFGFGAEAIQLLDEHWSVGLGSYTQFQDPKAQFAFFHRTRAALEWDLFPADDPRGNRLGVFYHLGWAVDRYNLRNVLGERFAQYPLHGIDAIGSVRHDGISYGLTLSSDVQLNHPTRRHILTAAPFVTFQLGTHVDLNLALSVTQRELPKPDPTAIDPSDYQTLSRLSFAEPFALTGTIGLTLHWDPTNGARNDRITSI